jgi:hypothetical protein
MGFVQKLPNLRGLLMVVIIFDFRKRGIVCLAAGIVVAFIHINCLAVAEGN